MHGTRNQVLQRVAFVSIGVPVARVRGMGKGASLGKEAVLADSRRAGEKSDFISILLGHRESRSR